MLVGHWTFDIETIDGRRVADAEAGLPAVLDAGVEIVPGADGQALAFDGRGRVEIPAAPQLVLSQIFGFTLAFWVKAAAGPVGEWRSLLYKPVAEHDARGVGLWLYPDAMRLRVQLFTVKGPEYADSRRTVPLGEWAHLALVVDTDGMFLYIDGRLDSAVPLEHPVVTPGGPFHLGGEPGRPGLTGLLEDFRVYASALDERDVRILAASPP
ncbi:LamG domain-containing protein [Actinomadura hibisca]|uniref:LamG domain-containing protein n=1 Tax=Actinomadura hibisca TaxID=68565 RepID=UPI00082CE30F|nr:LamG domain-containing protein [Actinomadura hibisca]